MAPLARFLPPRIFRPAPALLVFIASLASAAFAPAARAEIEFVGILVTPQLTRFALGDTSVAKTDWVTRGSLFSGYKVESFDAKTDTLTLSRDGTELRLRLKDDAKVKAARLELTGAISFGVDEKIEIERATLLFDQETVFPLKDGITYRITPTRRPDGNISYRIAVERTLAENKMERLSAPSVIAGPEKRFSVRIGELGFSFTPRSP